MRVACQCDLWPSFSSCGCHSPQDAARGDALAVACRGSATAGPNPASGLSASLRVATLTLVRANAAPTWTRGDFRFPLEVSRCNRWALACTRWRKRRSSSMLTAAPSGAGCVGTTTRALASLVDCNGIPLRCGVRNESRPAHHTGLRRHVQRRVGARVAAPTKKPAWAGFRSQQVRQSPLHHAITSAAVIS